MKISFLCGSLQPGADGVADYLLQLAGELTRTGHQVQVLALNDRYTANLARDSSSLRLPETLPWSRRTALAEEALRDFAPDWVSLQFVCYGWNRKGLVLPAIAPLTRLCAGRRTHVLMHETWIGQMRGAPLRQRLVGAVQRRMIGHLLRQVRPAVLQTTTPAYRALLAQLGLQAELLPLFGNIPIVEEPATLPALAAQHPALAPFLEARAEWLIGACFGSLYPGWQAEPMRTHLRAAAAQTGRRLGLLGLGRMSAGGRALWEALEAQAGEVRLLHLGELEPKQLSQVLQTVDFGLSNAPPVVAAKSGATVCLLEHGLPVVVCASPLTFRDPAANTALLDEQILPTDDQLPARLAQAARRPAAARLPAVARELLMRLQRAL